MMLLKDRVAVVTGGTRGIGYAIVKKYLENGAKVVLFGSKEESVNKAVQSLKAENPDWVVEGMWPNLTDSEEMEQAIAKVGEKYGRLDILVNNAGVTIKGKAEELSLEDWQTVISTNLAGSFLCAQHAANLMLPRGHGKIINVISTYAFVGRYLRVAYSASKGGELQMTKTMAMEWASRGVNVNALAPTATATPMTSVYETDAQARAEMEKKIPIGRLATPEDMIGAALFLASSASDFVTGHAILVDGGFTAI